MDKKHRILIENASEKEREVIGTYLHNEFKNTNSSMSWKLDNQIDQPIDKVTTELLDVACRMSGVFIDKSALDKIIDLIELIEQKGELVSIKDISILQAQWDNHPKP